MAMKNSEELIELMRQDPMKTAQDLLYCRDIAENLLLDRERAMDLLGQWMDAIEIQEDWQAELYQETAEFRTLVSEKKNG